MSRRRTRVIVVVVVVTVAAAAATVGARWVSSRDGGSPQRSGTVLTASDSPSPPAIAAPVDQVWVDEVSAALVSQDPRRVATVMPAVVAEAYLRAPAPLVPPETRLSVDLDGWTATSETTAHVPADLTGEVQERWLLLVVLEGDEWLVYGTAPEESGP